MAQQYRWLVAATALMAACAPEQPASTPEAPAPPVTAPVTPPAPAQPDEDAVPAHQYRGVAGFRAPQQGKCPDSYQLSNGLCVHDRLKDARTPQALAREMKAFMAGAVPPIVADAPPRAPRDPSKMSPGALQASEAQLRKREEGRARVAEAAEAAPAAPIDPATGRPTTPAGPKGGGAPQMQAALQLLGAGLASGKAESGSAAGPEMENAQRMLGQLQTMTGDGEVDIGEAGQLFQMLGEQLGSMEELPKELNYGQEGRGVNGR